MVRQRLFFLTQAIGSMELNGRVHAGTYVRNFYCDIDLNGEVMFDAVADAPYQWTLSGRPLLSNSL